MRVAVLWIGGTMRARTNRVQGSSESCRNASRVVTAAATSRHASRKAGLLFVSDQSKGILRQRRGRSFCYVGPSGRVLRSVSVLERIRKLAIPPAWENVWICSSARGHIQATGTDARGRKQYRYHADWTAHRGTTKFDRLEKFVRFLPRIRRRVARDLRRKGIPRERVLAAVVHLLERTLIRVGNDEYARTNRSYGATTLRKRHVSVRGSLVRLEFQGKSGVRHELALRDERLSEIVRTCQDLPGQDLFEYEDVDGVRKVRSTDVNDYLREISGADFTAKEFRTWAGTVLAARALNEIGPAETRTDFRRRVSEGVRRVAAQLGNTPAVCRGSYIHPAIIEAYELQRLPKVAVRKSAFAGSADLSAEERWVIRVLRQASLKPKPAERAGIRRRDARSRRHASSR